MQEDIVQYMNGVPLGESDNDKGQGPSHLTKKPRMEQQSAKRHGSSKKAEITDRKRSGQAPAHPTTTIECVISACRITQGHSSQ